MLLDHIYEGDCRDILAALPSNSVDVIFADPPYNLQLRGDLWRPNQTKVDAVDDAWDQIGDFQAYDQFTREWLGACRRVLKDTGTIWVIGSYHNIYRVGTILQDLGFWFLNDVVWVKCLAASTEVLCLVNDRPLVTSLKDLARIDAKINTIQLPSYDEQGCFTWVNMVALQKTQKTRGLHIVCEDGSWVQCTPEHRFPVARNGRVEYVAAESLRVNDTLLQLRRFELPTVVESLGIDEALGEFIGWYLAEGNLLDAEDGLQLSMAADELPHALRLIDLIKQRFGVVGRIHVYNNSLHLIFSSHFLVAFVYRFVRGKDAKTKRLAREAFFFGPRFLQGILYGYLQGDGHWDVKHQRWRLGLCRNEGLIMDLSILARLLGYRLRFAHAFVPYKRGQAEIIRGEMRDNTDARWSYIHLEELGLPARRFFAYDQRHSLAAVRANYKLVTRKNPAANMPAIANQVLYGDVQPVRIQRIDASPLADYYDVALATNHVFALANGLLTHNSNPMPNFRGVRFTNAHETLLWCKKSKDQKKYTFNYHAMKALNDDKQMRSDWQLPLCTGAERLRVNGEKLHTTQKPEALLYRVLLASTNPGDVVLDPFFGTGTTGAVAKKLGRHFVGVERDEHYIEAARARIDLIQPALLEPEVFGAGHTKRSAPRIPFGTLLEHGLLVPGQPLYFNRKRDFVATVLADGTLRLPGGGRGSIHKIGALVGNLPACNGWEHWFFEDEQGALVTIDTLREQIRRQQQATIDIL